MENISFERAKLEDALRISILLKTVYIQVYAVEGISFEFANFIEKKFSEGDIYRAIASAPDRYLIAYFNENPIGVAEVIYDSLCPIRKIKVPELGKLYVLERFYGKGIGFDLINLIEELVVQKGWRELNLEVYKKNIRAISFYKKCGYQILGEVDFPMETNTYRNLVMNKQLK